MNLAKLRREVQEMKRQLRAAPPERRCCNFGITPERFRLEYEHQQAGTAPPVPICTRSGGPLCELASATHSRVAVRLEAVRQRMEGLTDDSY